MKTFFEMKDEHRLNAHKGRVNKRFCEKLDYVRKQSNAAYKEIMAIIEENNYAGKPVAAAIGKILTEQKYFNLNFINHDRQK